MIYRFIFSLLRRPTFPILSPKKIHSHEEDFFDEEEVSEEDFFDDEEEDSLDEEDIDESSVLNLSKSRVGNNMLQDLYLRTSLYPNETMYIYLYAFCIVLY